MNKSSKRKPWGWITYLKCDNYGFPSFHKGSIREDIFAPGIHFEEHDTARNCFLHDTGVTRSWFSSLTFRKSFAGIWLAGCMIGQQWVQMVLSGKSLLTQGSSTENRNVCSQKPTERHFKCAELCCFGCSWTSPRTIRAHVCIPKQITILCFGFSTWTKQCAWWAD